MNNLQRSALFQISRKTGQVKHNGYQDDKGGERVRDFNELLALDPSRPIKVFRPE